MKGWRDHWRGGCSRQPSQTSTCHGYLRIIRSRTCVQADSRCRLSYPAAVEPQYCKAEIDGSPNTSGYSRFCESRPNKAPSYEISSCGVDLLSPIHAYCEALGVASFQGNLFSRPLGRLFSASWSAASKHGGRPSRSALVTWSSYTSVSAEWIFTKTATESLHRPVPVASDLASRLCSHHGFLHCWLVLTAGPASEVQPTVFEGQALWCGCQLVASSSWRA